jgi:hypothetical protein
MLLFSLLLVAAPTLSLPEPAMPAPREIAERGESPVYYRLPNDTFLPSFRAAIGSASRLALNGESAKTAFGFDLLLGAAVAPARGSRFTLLGEGGYSFVVLFVYFASLGVGPLVRENGTSPELDHPFGESLTLGLVPHVLLGSANGDFARGLRTSFVFGWLAYTFEIAHQYVETDLRHVHEIHLAFTPFFAYPSHER